MKKNFWLKLASMVLAVVMWLFVISNEQSTVNITVPVEFKDIPAGLEMVNEEAAHTISLSIKGHERFLKTLNRSEIHVYVDMASARKGEHYYVIEEKNVRLPAFLKPIGISPPSIRVKIERTGI